MGFWSLGVWGFGVWGFGVLGVGVWDIKNATFCRTLPNHPTPGPAPDHLAPEGVVNCQNEVWPWCFAKFNQTIFGHFWPNQFWPTPYSFVLGPEWWGREGNPETLGFFEGWGFEGWLPQEGCSEVVRWGPQVGLHVGPLRWVRRVGGSKISFSFFLSATSFILSYLSLGVSPQTNSSKKTVFVFPELTGNVAV